MIHSLSSLTSFNAYFLLFAVKDRTDTESQSHAKFHSTLSKIWMFLVGIVGANYNINEFRKFSYNRGLFILSLNWLLMSIFFYYDSYWYTIPAGYIVATLEGTLFMPFYKMILETCGEKLFTFSLCTYMLFNTLISYVTPY